MLPQKESSEDRRVYPTLLLTTIWQVFSAKNTLRHYGLLR